ncbi:MAG TPA: lysylphosphatidylglycerol synthase domain-containing protein, partial [Saprospiraceae bacterium]|nr:lysylphosphatidylglycerol synthase domain-containing protein [Saprospiraceae bacterium]
MTFSFSTSFGKTALSVAFAVLMLALGLHFLLSEGVHLAEVRNALGQSDRRWLYLGIGLSLAYIGLHSEMYFHSFRALGLRVGRDAMMRLYLKRNLVSVFLPAGFIASQAFFSGEAARSEKVQERDVLSASGIFAVAALLSMVIVVVPALGWLLTQHILPGGAAEAFLVMSALFIGLVWAMFNFTKHGIVYRWLQKYIPAFTARLDKLDWSRFQTRYLLYAVLLSCLVEVLGVLHVFIAARTLGASPTLPMAFAGYMAVLVVLMTSPFLRGVGAVEALLALVLIRFGLPPVEAVSAAVLFRFFEFWLILLLAVPVFLFRPGNLVVRLAPALLLFALGAVDILSGLTPSMAERAKVLGDYLPLGAIHASAALTVAVGFVLLGTAFYLFRGLRSAWWLALGLSAVSLVSHLTKGIDYEEATLALLTIGALLYQHGQYNVRTDFRMARRNWLAAFIVVKTVLILGTVAFYLLDHQHFGADFSWKQSARYALQTYLLMDPAGLHPLTVFGIEFLELIHLLGGLTLLFLAYTVFRPFLPRFENEASAREKAAELVKQYGHSSLDYFKTYHDKKFFFAGRGDSF